MYIWATQIERPIVKVPVGGLEVGEPAAALQSRELQLKPTGANYNLPGPDQRTRHHILSSLRVSV